MRYFFFFLLSLLLLTLHRTTARNLIYETCSSASRDNRNVNYQFCKTSLLPAPAAQRTSVQKLGMFSITLIQKNMKEDMTYMTKLIKKKGLNKSVKNSITACSDLYSQTLDDLSDAVLNYKSKNFYEVNQDISAASTAAASCEDGFKERGVVSPLTQRNDKMVQLSAIALNIVNLYARVQ